MRLITVILGLATLTGAQNLPYRVVVTQNNVATTGELCWEIQDKDGVVIQAAQCHNVGVGATKADYDAIMQRDLRRKRAQDMTFSATTQVNEAWPTVSWAQITGKPATYPPEAHAHPLSDLSGCADGQIAKKVAGTWQCANEAGGAGVPAGAVVLIVSGSCSATLGAGWAEEASLNGKFALGTVAANADIGGAGGSDNITQTLNHTHGVTVTDPGHVHVQGVNSAATGGLSGYTADTSTNTRVNSGYSTSSATTGITAAADNPAGGVASIDNRPAFVKVIFCRKN